MCMNITDTGATQAWAVSFFFLNLVLAITIAILFMSNTGPGNYQLITNQPSKKALNYSLLLSHNYDELLS